MKTKTFLLLLAALALTALLSSCGGEKNPDETADGCMSIDAWGKGEKMKQSDIIDTIEYIPLETNENCLIGRIDKVIGMGDTIAGLERRKKNPFHYTTMCGTDDFVLLNTTAVDKNSRYIAIDKNTGHVKLSTKAGKGRRIIENDMDIFADFGEIGADSRYIYSDTDPAIFKFLTEKYINKYNKPMVEHYKDRRSEDSNPVIMAFRTKGF